MGGWDKDNFTKGSNNGIFEMEGIKFGIRICFEIRFPEFFRELYKRNTDINLVLFYDVADIDDNERYNMISVPCGDGIRIISQKAAKSME